MTFGIGADVVAAIGLIKEWAEWEEEAAYIGGEDLLARLKKRGDLPEDRDYRWVNSDKVDTLTLCDTHEIVWIADRARRKRRKIKDRRGHAVLLVHTHATT